jgi:hypothetical protein
LDIKCNITNLSSSPIRYVITFIRYVITFIRYVITFIRYVITFIGYVITFIRYVITFIGYVITFIRYVITFIRYVITFIRYTYKTFESQIIEVSLGAGRSKGLNRIAKSDFCNRLIFAILFRPIGLLAPVWALWFTFSCLGPLVYLLLFRSFGLLAPV